LQKPSLFQRGGTSTKEHKEYSEAVEDKEKDHGSGGEGRREGGAGD